MDSLFNHENGLVGKIALMSRLLFPTIMEIVKSFSIGKIYQIFWMEHCWSYQGAIRSIDTAAFDNLRDLLSLVLDTTYTTKFELQYI